MGFGTTSLPSLPGHWGVVPEPIRSRLEEHPAFLTSHEHRGCGASKPAKTRTAETTGCIAPLADRSPELGAPAASEAAVTPWTAAPGKPQTNRLVNREEKGTKGAAAVLEHMPDADAEEMFISIRWRS